MRKIQRTSFHVILGLISIAVLVNSLTSAVTNVNQDTNIIVIGTGIDIVYNVTSIHLEKNTQYTIVFEIFEEGNVHNLIIDVDNDVSETNLVDSDDIRLGIANDATTLGGKTVWNTTWTTPNEDIVLTYFCGIPGHFGLGMSGKFIIGNGYDTIPSRNDFWNSVLAGGILILVFLGFYEFVFRPLHSKNSSGKALCKECGEKLRNDYKYCEICGLRVNKRKNTFILRFSIYSTTTIVFMIGWLFLVIISSIP